MATGGTSGGIINTAATEQFYRPGMYEQLKHMSTLHGRGKGRKRATPHGIHGHGKEPHYADVFGGRGAIGRTGKAKGGGFGGTGARGAHGSRG